MQEIIKIMEKFDLIISFILGMVCILLRDLYFERKTATNIYTENTLYQKKFEIYQFIWERLFLCIDAANKFLNNANDELKIYYKYYIMYYNNLLIRYNNYHYFLKRWEPFCQKEIYDNFFEIDNKIKILVHYISENIQMNIVTDNNYNNFILQISDHDYVKIEYKENVVEYSLDYRFLTIEVLDYPDSFNALKITLNKDIKFMNKKLNNLQNDIAKKIRVNDKIYKK